jgi:predicted nucleic acid-binding protein
VRAVADAGPIIHLSWLNRLHLPSLLFEEVLIPEAVRSEVLAASPGTPGLDHIEQAISEKAWRVLSVDPQRLSALDALDPGEAEAIALAEQQKDCLLLTDDRLARTEAEHRGIGVIGTIGVLILARNRGLIAAVLPLLLELRHRGQWISDDLIDLVRREENSRG